MRPRHLIRLTHTAQIISECWNAAERGIRLAVRQRHWGPSEEDITFLLRGELRNAVAKATKKGVFERAFVMDLQLACRGAADSSRLRDLASGLVGTVSFHNRRHEGKSSASDIGMGRLWLVRYLLSSSSPVARAGPS